MRYTQRFRAIPFLIATSLFALLVGCTTPAPVQESAADHSSGEQSVTSSTASRQDQTATREVQPEAATVSGNASVFLTDGLAEELEPVMFGDVAAAGWYYPPVDEGESGPGAMGLYMAAQSLVLADRSIPVSAEEEAQTTRVTPLLPPAENRRIRAFEPIELQVASGRPAGFRIRFSENNRDEEIFVIWTARTNGSPHTVRLPMSAVRRTAFRDLTDDGIREMVHLSVVFDATGNREIIVDALRWEATRFVHIGSIPLIQTINRELTALEGRLRTDGSSRWRSAANLALQPIEGSPPVASLLPANQVRIPRITELSLDLSRGSWEFTHDIAVDGHIYRLRIQLEANPLREQPAQIDGIQGL